MVHLFINGEFARSIWKYYANAIGLQGPFIQVHQAIKKWWDIRHCAKLTPILQVGPAFICWQLWKRRTTIEHGEYDEVEDGACRGNPGERSAAFCIRDADDNLVYVEAKRLWITNSIHAEARAIQGGIQHCIEQQRVSILIESDSLAIINMTEGKWEALWEIRMEITSINF
ncbi:hypothetical protein KY290_024985 [Solanum tuberosum]|uniref:RNase H type-1 domain-containing protein n=1 Tax=Solanum tuberosum TaxID=4113 RepID=A0ABQ7USA8_SOLTU|nr:hypothetical protein KY284_023843 [Solanum tuberosum]KAH0754715.1 hypothetical protein KY290_024985 [Solanum tuberosum]